MPIQLIEDAGGKFLELTVSGKLTHEDYQNFGREFERAAKQHPKMRLLVMMMDFHGWYVKGAWDDFRFGVKYHNDVERLAMVGEKKWQHCMAAFCEPFTTGETRYFDFKDVTQAREWVEAEDRLSKTN